MTTINVAKKRFIPVSERRRFIRHPLCFPLSYRVLDAKPAEAVDNRSTSINVSIGGLLFAAKRPVKIGSFIMLRMPFQDKVFNVKAKVVRCDKSAETKLYNIGAAFQRLNAAYKVKLIEQLYLISEFRDLRSIQLGHDISLERASREWIKRYSERFRRMYW